MVEGACNVNWSSVVLLVTFIRHMQPPSGLHPTSCLDWTRCWFNIVPISALEREDADRSAIVTNDFQSIFPGCVDGPQVGVSGQHATQEK